jgi:hypothetical protein
MSTPSPLARVAEELCLQWQHEFAWPEVSASYRAVAAWSSRTAEFFRCLPLDGIGGDVVVKIVLRGQYVDTEDHVRALLALADLAAATPSTIARGVVPLGWSRNPPAVGLEHVPGRDLPELLPGALRHGAHVLGPLFRTCGATLAAWHGSATIDGDNVRSDALDRAMRLARLQGIRPSRLAPGEHPAAVVRRFRDYSVHNLRVSDHGEPVIVDPPRTTVEADLPHRDMAWFMSSVDAHYSRLRADARAPLRRDGRQRYRAIRSELFRMFVQGYESAGRHRLSDPDLCLVAALEGAYLLGRTRALFRQRQVRRAAICARLAFDARRRAVGRSTRHVRC